MNRYALTHLDDHVLLRDLVVHVTRNCAATADLLAHLAEVDARKLYLLAAHPSMHSYCVHVLRLSEDAASKRIHVARKAREFPGIFSAVTDGRLHLSGAVLLAPHLTPDNADELLAAAAHKTKAEVEAMLAQRFPKPDLPTRIGQIASDSPLISESFAPALTTQHAPGHVEAPYPRVTPLAPERFSVQFTVGQETYETLRYVQALLGHQVPTGDVAEVFDRGLHALRTELEKTRFAATARPRAGRQRTSDNPRYVPTHVKRAVWVRDGGQCAFVSENGARCPERSRLEFDHIVEVARGGEATIDGMRLRCRAHNQYEAERTFGAGFMQLKRDEARRLATERRAVIAAQPDVQGAMATDQRSTAPATPEPSANKACAASPSAQERVAAESAAGESRAAAERAETEARAAADRAAAARRAVELDLMHCFKKLGFPADQARLAIQHCGSDPDTPLEQHVHAALKFLGARGRTYALGQAARSSAAAGIAAGRLATP